MDTKQKKRKMYTQDASVSIKIQKRDLDILYAVFQHRFLDTDLIVLYTGASRQGIQRRLNKLYHNKYLSRPKSQLTRFGNHSMVYGLGIEGAKLLSQYYDLDLDKINWTTKNREAKGEFIEHTLMVAKFLIITEVFCNKYKSIEYIPAHKIIEKRRIPASEKYNPLSWMIQGKTFKNFNSSVIPDGLFALRLSLSDGRKLNKYFFLEADRSTMPIKRNNLKQTSFYKKLIAYWESYNQKLYEKYWGFKSVRLLTLTISKQRAMNIVEAAQSLDTNNKGMKMFLFAPESLFQMDKIDEYHKKNWINGLCQETSILEL